MGRVVEQGNLVVGTAEELCQVPVRRVDGLTRLGSASYPPICASSSRWPVMAASVCRDIIAAPALFRCTR